MFTATQWIPTRWRGVKVEVWPGRVRDVVRTAREDVRRPPVSVVDRVSVLVVAELLRSRSPAR